MSAEAKRKEGYLCPFCYKEFRSVPMLTIHEKNCPERLYGQVETDIIVPDIPKTRKGTKAYYKETVVEPFLDAQRRIHAGITCQAKLDKMTDPRQREAMRQWCFERGIPLDDELRALRAKWGI